jgi:hypothetical protein
MGILLARVRSVRMVALLSAVLILGSCATSWSTIGFGPDRASNNAAETTLTTANVAGLTEAWTAAVPGSTNGSPPVVANGAVFVAAGSLLAFSANGSTGCAGTPKVCQPVWTAADGGTASPSTAGNVVYTVSPGLLTAYDARGTTNCSGTPKTCTPLWTATIGSAAASPAVANGKVYVRSDKLYAFDAAGTTGCSGTPKTCAPLWTASGPSPAGSSTPAWATRFAPLTAPGFRVAPAHPRHVSRSGPIRPAPSRCARFTAATWPGPRRSPVAASSPWAWTAAPWPWGRSSSSASTPPVPAAARAHRWSACR